MPKKAKVQVSEDEIRIAILGYLYNAWKNPRGMESHKLKISKITSDLKKKGIEKKYVVRNLVYLIETGWAIEEVKQSQFFTGKMRIPTEKKSYRISKDGIDFFEGSSKFQKVNKMTGINITNVQGVVSIGNNNYIRNEFVPLFESLDDLGRQIRLSNELKDQEKMNFQAEVDTIQSQLKKEKPDKGIIKTAWNALKDNLPTVSGLVVLMEQVKPLIEGLI